MPTSGAAMAPRRAHEPRPSGSAKRPGRAAGSVDPAAAVLRRRLERLAGRRNESAVAIVEREIGLETLGRRVDRRLLLARAAHRGGGSDMRDEFAHQLDAALERRIAAAEAARRRRDQHDDQMRLTMIVR